jgi:uncharacterized lipoprotein YmbA
MNRRLRQAAAVLAVAVLLGCAGPKESVVLLPSPSGQEAVSVTQGSRQLLLTSLCRRA